MILLFNIDPFSRWVAISEMLLLLSLAAFVGWLLARLILKGRIDSLRKTTLERSQEVDECNNSLLAFNDVESFGATSISEDDLKVIEGIGPKIETLLKSRGIATYYRLAITPTEFISEILSQAGSRYQMHDPSSWGKQAELANSGRWEELEKLQNHLNGGRE